jgi:hypothetical protein
MIQFSDIHNTATACWHGCVAIPSTRDLNNFYRRTAGVNADTIRKGEGHRSLVLRGDSQNRNALRQFLEYYEAREAGCENVGGKQQAVQGHASPHDGSAP